MIITMFENLVGTKTARDAILLKPFLEFDGVVNRQREQFYGRRNDVLHQAHHQDMLFGLFEGFVEENIRAICDGREGSREAVVDWVEASFPVCLGEAEGLDDKTPGEIVALVVGRAKESYLTAWKLWPPAKRQAFERRLLLDSMDSQWRIYLRAMGGLRESIHMFALGQQGLLVEFKREAARLFAELEQGIRAAVGNGLFESSAPGTMLS